LAVFPRHPRHLLAWLCALATVAAAGCGVGDASSDAEALAVPAGDPTADREPTDDAAGVERELPVLDTAPPRLDLDYPETVAVVGDSLTLAASEQILRQLGQRNIDVVGLDARESRRMMRRGPDLPSGADAVEAVLETAEPDMWVIALGTNDVGSGLSSEAIGDDARQLLDLVPDDAEVVWVDVWIRDRPDEVTAANRTLRRVIGERDGTTIVDWNAHGDDVGVVIGDGIHLSEYGELVFARAIATGVETLSST
jgi:lysophospholipase L1-like esterase